MITLTKLKNYYNWGGRFLNDPFHKSAKELNILEAQKQPLRSDVINFLLDQFQTTDIQYLEIGVRNPDDNFNKINAVNKYGVDPGVEFPDNPVQFKMTSDDFFNGIRNGEIFDPTFKFDVIFVDGLHLADQVERDIQNALEFLSPSGFIILHDCNPPTEWHARETYPYQISPAMNNWNGTTWKAFVKARELKDVSACCIDTDWGVGVISKYVDFGNPKKVSNPFFEFHVFEKDRVNQLNLISYEKFKGFFKS
jgi:SAM-dependent methyltransferase